MFSPDDTIVAVATPSGHGGVGVVRLSGPDAAAIGARLTGRHTAWPPRRVVHCRVDAGTLLADALVTSFPAPASYTGEDVVEISAHGSPVILAAIVSAAIGHGARPARAGEFTLRAFVHGKLDLVQAESVRDLVAAVSPAQVRAAASQLDGSLSNAIVAIGQDLRRLETLLEASLDFPDEGYRFIEPGGVAAAVASARDRVAALVSTAPRGELVRDGASVVIAGVPNVGKSSVFNALVGVDRAIVTPVAGTTRDLVSERLVLEGALVLLADTAGLREEADTVEAEGIRRAETAIETADVVVVILDRSRAPRDDERALVSSLMTRDVVLAANKSDLPAAWSAAEFDIDVTAVSARTGEGIAALSARIAAKVSAGVGRREDVIVTNERHRTLLAQAHGRLTEAAAAIDAAGGTLPEEFVVADVRAVLASLDDVIGRRTPDALLEEIFAGFCIGK